MRIGYYKGHWDIFHIKHISVLVHCDNVCSQITFYGLILLHIKDLSFAQTGKLYSIHTHAIG